MRKMNKIRLGWLFALLLIIIPLSVYAVAPTHDTPLLNSTFRTNLTSENLTVYNISTADAESNPVKNIISWYKNNTPFMLLNMPFELTNGTDTRDYSGFQNNGTQQNGVIWNATGGYDGKGAYTFDGLDDKILLSTFKVPESITILAWVYPVTLPTEFSSIIDCNGDVLGFFGTVTTNTLSFYRSPSGASVSNRSMTLNKWNFVGVTHNKTDITYYIDGTPAGTSGFTDIPTGTGCAISQYADDGVWNGNIDDVLIYNNVSLSAQQVLAVYQNKTNFISSSLLIVNDTWNASITPNDGTADGLTKFSTGLKIRTTVAPTIETPVFNLTTVTTTSGIKANTTYRDTDGDLGNITFAWYRDGAEVFTDNYTNIPSITIVNSTLNTTFYGGSDLLNVTVFARSDIDYSSLNFSTTVTVTPTFDNCPGDTINGWWDISNTQTVNTTQNITCEYINISNGGRLYINSSINNVTVNITVGNLTIQAGGEINGTGTGFANASGESPGTSAAGSGGGGHGGRGGAGQAGFNGGNHYGNPLEPRTLGSGGGGAAGGDGGGSVLINVSNTTWINGTIAINGEPSKAGSEGAGGAGGSLFIDTDSLLGNGTIQAKGGQGRDGTNDGGSGGGGRVAIYYKQVGSGFSFNNTNVQGVAAITANAVKGEPGTAVFIQKDNKELYIVGGFDFNLATYNYSNVTIEHALLRVNRSFEFNATNIVNTGSRVSNMTCYNTSHDWTLRSLQVLGLDNVNITDKGREYMECGNITIHRLETRTNYTVNNLIILSNKTLVFNVTSDDLVLKSTILLGNVNISNVVNLSLDSTSFINATARGNPNGTFEGKGGNGGASISAGGGGYGGIGGISENNIAGGPQYGDPFAPRLFGAPGGVGHNGPNRGTAGGGIVYLNISGTLWNNGTISADGEDKTNGDGNGGGAGSGGSIWIDTSNYYGTGKLLARGGTTASAANAAGTGGGGRIAVYYNTTNSEVLFNRTDVQSPDSVDTGTGGGHPGTAIFIDKDDKNLYIVGGFDFTLATYNYSNVTIEHAFLRVNNTFELNATGIINTGNRVSNMTCYNTSHDWTIRSLLVLGLDNMNVSDKGANYNECGNITIHRIETRTNYTMNNVVLFSNKTLIFNVTSDDLILNATQLIGNMNITNLTNLTIYSTSFINATARGNPNGTFEGKGTDANEASGGGGGAYGGIAGDSETGSNKGGNQYGNPFVPNLFGAPGGAGNNGANKGRNGGGLVYLNISGTLWNNGTISVDGEEGLATPDLGGGGSGGSIWIDTTNYYGTGVLFARGGTVGASTDEPGAGSGGRIAVYYNTTDSNVAFNTTSISSRIQGTVATDTIGHPGTAIFIDKDDKNLYIVGGFDFNLATYNYSNVTIEHAFLRVNNTFELNATGIINTGNRVSNMTCYNTSHDWTIRSLLVLGLDNMNVSKKGANYNECGNITIHRIETRTNYTMNNVVLFSNKTLIFNVTSDDLILNATQLIGDMNITVANLTINVNSSLIANFRGYWNGTGPGTGVSRASSGGAGYGGAGGAGSVAGSTGGAAYGSNVTPGDYGSGGAGSSTSGSAYGGNGGGFIFINATNRLEVNGTINASGQSGATTSSTSSGGGGSGGSIWIWTRILNGTGILSAHGGNGADGSVNDGGGGGGGRIAVYFRDDQSNAFTRDVRGGEGFTGTDGAAGTVEFLQTNDTINPSITVLKPNANSAIAVNARVNISMTATDNDEVNIVLINITYPDNTTKVQLNISNFTVVGSIYNHSFADTSQAGTYNITFFANDTSGNRNETEKTNFTIDNILPSVATIRPAVNAAFNTANTVVNVSATVTDNVAVDVVLANITYPDNTTKEQLKLVNGSGASPSIFNFSFGNTSSQGHYNITFIANDSVGNINSTEKTNFTIDTVAPGVTVLRPALNTVFDNGSLINLSATAVDGLLAVDRVLVNLTYPDNTSKEQFILQRVGNIYNFSINITNQSGVYNVTFIANDTVSNINSTEKTNFTINATVISESIDIANTTNITFTPDPIRQNDIVSFNATFNVTGNLNATNVNITLTVDNTFIMYTNVSIANGTTRQVELNWTAQNGTHAIRINADANNTYNTETFENNNNATATITVFNVSVLNFTSPSQNAEIIRGKDTNSLPGEDTLKKVSNFTTIQAKVYNKYMTGQGVNSNCTYYFNNTIFLGWNQTNTTGECTFTYDHTIYATGIYNVTVNYTNLNTTNYLTDTNASLIQNTSAIDLGKVEINLAAENQRTGSLYNPGDVAIMNITVTKNSTAYDPDKFTVEVKDPGTECNTAGGILFNHSYPGDIVRVSTGIFQSFSVLEIDTDVHWCVVINNSAAAPLGSASHSDKEVTNTNANRANLTIVNSASQGDDAVFDDINITLFSSIGSYRIFDRNFSADSGENRVLTLNERYGVLFRDSARQEQLNITGLNITAGNKSLPFSLLINYSGALPVRFTNITDIIAFNNSGFSFTSANITLQKNNVNATKIVHCTNWNFSAGACIGSWEINLTSDYANFGENATHMWFQVTGFTAYAGGNGSNANLTIYDQADAEGGSIAAQVGNNINFTANYTRVADNTSITGASCNISFSTAPLGPSAMTYNSTKQIYNFTRTFNATGNFTWNATCGAASFDTLTATDTIEVSDTTAPVVSAISPTSITSAQQYTFSATVIEQSSPLTCNLFINNANDGAMTVSGTTVSRVASYNVSSQQNILFYANCTDPAGNIGFNVTNVTVGPQELGGGNPGGGSRAGGESSAATADGLEGGTTYLNLGQGDIIAITEGNVESQVRVLAVYPNSVRLDIGGYNVILLEGLFKRYDLNNNGILETTVYVDDVVSYSKAAISILVKEDGGTVTAQSSQFFDVLGSIWERVVGQQETGVEEATEEEEGADQTQEQAEEPVVAQEEKPKESYTKRILNFMVEFGEYVKSKGGMTGGVVAAQGENLQGIIRSPAQKAILVSILTLGVLIPVITGSYVYRKKYKKRKNKIAQEIEKEMKYKGL